MSATGSTNIIDTDEACSICLTDDHLVCQAGIITEDSVEFDGAAIACIMTDIKHGASTATKAHQPGIIKIAQHLVVAVQVQCAIRLNDMI